MRRHALNAVETEDPNFQCLFESGEMLRLIPFAVKDREVTKSESPDTRRRGLDRKQFGRPRPQRHKA